MTSEEIDALPAGRELDVLIAEKVMGEDVGPREHQWERKPTGEIDMRSWSTDEGDSGPFCPRCDSMGPSWGDALDSVCDVEPKPYSTDIAAAWTVVEEFEGYFIHSSGIDEPHTCSLPSTTHSTTAESSGWCEGVAKTLPLAICRAALKAVSA